MIILDPILFDTKMFAVHCSWNHNGSLLAISGKQFTDDKELNLVQFYNPFGEVNKEILFYNYI